MSEKKLVELTSFSTLVKLNNHVTVLHCIIFSSLSWTHLPSIMASCSQNFWTCRPQSDLKDHGSFLSSYLLLRTLIRHTKWKYQQEEYKSHCRKSNRRLLICCGLKSMIKYELSKGCSHFLFFFVLIETHEVGLSFPWTNGVVSLISSHFV